MGEGSEEILDLKSQRRIRRMANRNFGISMGAAVMLQLWYFFNPSTDSHQWPLIVGLVLLPCSFCFYVSWLSHLSLGRLFHYFLLTSALVPDFLGFWRGDQATFLGEGIWWPLFWYGIAVGYFSFWAILVVYDFYESATEDVYP
ncbi:MAG: hypothetical protein RLZZ519_1653 [Bacteroidota bacterium]|jgi:hypothetical protein